jgi:hypothetical protein
MTFDSMMLGILAREHQRELIEAAAERRLVRNARERHPARRRWFRGIDRPPAA